MFTLCYPFRSQTGAQMIVDGTSIREYVEATAREYGVDDKLRFNRRVVRAEWSSSDARRTVEIERGDTGETELSSGYVRRAVHLFPRQGSGDPWYRPQRYPRDRRSVMRAPLDDPALEFSRVAIPARAESRVVVQQASQ